MGREPIDAIYKSTKPLPLPKGCFWLMRRTVDTMQVLQVGPVASVLFDDVRRAVTWWD